jgi:hypothetical protein
LARHLASSGEWRLFVKSQKAAKCGPFCRLPGWFLRRGDCLADLGGFELAHSRLEKPFEMSGEFPHGFPEFEARDFRLPTRPRSARRTSSPTRVASKRDISVIKRVLPVFADNIRDGSKGDFEPRHRHFHLTPKSRHSAARLACPKSAKETPAKTAIRALCPRWNYTLTPRPAH